MFIFKILITSVVIYFVIAFGLILSQWPSKALTSQQTLDFDSIVDGNNVTKAKPDPEVFLLAAKQLGVNANNCVVFEDAVAGIQAANTAKMVSIGIGDEKVLNEAQFNFTDFTEMSTEFLKELLEG